jgi:hypothetical protein
MLHRCAKANGEHSLLSRRREVNEQRHMCIKVLSVMTAGNFFSTRHSALRLTMYHLSGSLEKHFEEKGF